MPASNLDGFCLRALLLILLTTLAACRSSFEVDVAQARAKIQQGAQILDVRSQAEWDAGHLADARHMPIDQLPQQLSTLDIERDQSLVVYCQSGGRASQAGKILQQHGFTDVSVLRPGGYAELKAAGLSVE